jgi:hypothetical protein
MGMSTSMLPSNEVDQVYGINFGENIRSFRTLLKRQQGLLAYTNTTNTDTSLFVSTYPPNQRYRGGKSLSGVSYRLRGQTNLFDYLRGAFVGMRGGYRWSAWSYLGGASTEGYSVSRYVSNEEDFSTFSQEGITHSSHTGTHFAVQSANPAINVEVPYYDTSRFVSAQDYKAKALRIFPDPGVMQRVKITVYKKPEEVVMALAGAPADDFNFIGRVGAPPVLNLWSI